MMDQQKVQGLFMQWLMSKRICTLEDAEGFYRKLFDDESNSIEAGSIGGFEALLDSCASSLSLFGLKLQRRFIVNDTAKREYIGICNTISDKIARIATNMSPVDIKNFKLIVEELKRSDDFEVSFNAVSILTGLSRNGTSNYLNLLIDNEWLAANPETDKFHLGPRSVLELDDVLRESLADEVTADSPAFLECSLCFGLIVTGSKCHCKAATCRQNYHKYCLASYQRTLQKSECPGCKSELPLEHVDSHLNE